MEEVVTLKRQAREAPLEAGVYLMKDSGGRIIYVGKARVLRNRLLSYFSGEKDVKTKILLSRAASVETIITSDEYEALLLENTLIKQHGPRYNLKLTDGKTYPVVRLTGGPYPRVFRTRHIVEDGSSYFGPFPNVGAVDRLLEFIDRNFPLRKCRVLKKRTGPCMYYHIGRCSAPCCGKTGEAEYAVHTSRVRRLLAGETAPLAAELTRAMNAEAAALRFERAAALRDAVRAVGELSASSAVVDFDPEGRDYIAWAEEGVLATWTVFSMRAGKLTGRELYPSRSASSAAESLETFIASYYNPSRPPPPRIFIGGEVSPPASKPAAFLLPPSAGDAPASPPSLPQPLPETSLASGETLAGIRRWFRESFGLEPELIFCGAEQGRHAAVLAMARQNAAEDIRRRIRERGAGPALDELAAALKLRARPERIEGFDIAQLDGKHPVASLVSFRNGIPNRKDYRHFRLREVVGIVDDFAAVREAVRRRYTRLLRENRELPDLILIDGGAGQVNAAKGILDELGIDCDLAGLAKREEELWLPGVSGPLKLSRRSEALRILQHVRDETHRFATSLNQKLRSKELRLSVLESVEGIGPARAAALIKAFGGIHGVASASAEDVAAACGCGLAAARAVRAAARLAGKEQLPFRRGGLSAARLAELAMSGQDMAADPEAEYTP